jgi:amino acid adenylation domain-containing protein
VTQQTPEQKRELLARLLRARSNDDHPEAIATSPMRTIPRGGDLPMSFGQKRVWFQEEMQPESLAYNVLIRVGLSGRLDIEVLRRSMEVVIARHEALRATFPTVNGLPVERIMPPTRWPLPVRDLRDVPETDREDEERRCTTEAAKTRFNLATGPLLKSLVLWLAHEEYILVLVFHHIAIDGWSIDLFLREMAAVYGAFVSGTIPNLPDLPVQYADFAQWQRKWLTGDVFEKHRAYWAKKLAGPLPVLELPTDRLLGPETTYEGRTRQAVVGGAVLAGLREFSRREGVTLYTTVLAALKALLHRYAAQDDIVVGTYVAGRARSEVDSLIGFFVNTLVLRTELSGDPTFREALQRTRDVLLDANTHAGFPYEKLLEELRPQRSLSRAPLFQITFNFLGFRYGADLSLPDLRVQSLPSLEFHSTTENLSIFAFDRKSTLEFTLVYNPQLFDAETIDLFLDHFKVLLAGIVADPEARLSTLPLLSPPERHRLLVDFNSSEATFPADQCFSAYFEEQVRRTPDAIAVEDDGGTLTYSELNARANRIARTLVSAGGGAGQPVALLAERGRTLLTWILATFKAGGVYLPIDPRYPVGRHTSILRQGGAGIVLVADELAGRLEEAIANLPATSLPRVFRTGALGADEGDATNLSSRSQPEDVAYIIFTSGSTGSPKGAMVPHRAMLNHFWSKIRGFDITPNDVIVQSAPQGFDISVWQFLAGLLVGARIRVAPDSVTAEPEKLFALIEREGITLAQIVPSFLRALLDEPPHRAGGGAFGRLRWLILIGEALAPESCRRWLARHPGTPIANTYGPTECADEVTRQFITTPPGEGEVRVSIGRPIHNVRVYVVDANLALAAQGVAGELCIAGVCVGRGYVNDPERTEASFVPDPFSAEPGARMYRTGDRARLRHDGTIDFLGRSDFQVKLRGHRIELGEIEVVIAQHPIVKETVVNIWPGPQGPRLAAHVVLTTPADATIGDVLRSHVRATLPRYMVPDSFVILPSLPLSANGKVNRAALPAPEAPVVQASVPPRTETEKIVARVWAEVLGLERVGINENFFELGGHSLIATRVVSRLRESLGRDVPLRRIFEVQTVAELAASLDAEAAGTTGGSPFSRESDSVEPVLGRVLRDAYRRTALPNGGTTRDEPT